MTGPGMGPAGPDPVRAGADADARPAAPTRPPTIGAALRQAAWDVYSNSWRVVPWNLLWAGSLVAALWAWSSLGTVQAVVVGTLMALPLAALARIGAMATRGRDVNLSDGMDVLRARIGAVLVAGLAWLVAVLLFATNVASGLAIGGPIGWGLATLAAWGLVGTAAFGLAWWPLIADPDRVTRSARDLARLAGLLVLAHPKPLGMLTVVLAVLLLVSTVLFAVLITVAVGFAVAVACRVVLPAADRLDARLAARAAEAAPAAEDATLVA